MAFERQPDEVELIPGDRRSDRRYEMHLDLRWKLIRRKRVLETGVGNTVDLSSGGIQFNANRSLPVGLNAELSVSWPAMLHNTAPMQLVISGRIVRCDGHRVSLQMVQHEFRTVATVSEHRKLQAISVLTPPFKQSDRLIAR
ncbi:MAG TPA: PilZ domain-containing protein [Candidatus Sulfopaludibacter sp.]|jgi:hypothetical protein|nr:PilZ domain-containing protein [Candidatus Sulfopaludibacter sp.]